MKYQEGAMQGRKRMENEEIEIIDIIMKYQEGATQGRKKNGKIKYVVGVRT